MSDQDLQDSVKKSQKFIYREQISGLPIGVGQ